MPDQDSQSTVNRDALRTASRRENLAARKALSAARHAQASEAVRAHLEIWLTARTPGILAFCLPIQGEIDCRPMVERLLAIGWQAAMPVVVEKHAPMIFRPWSPSMPMTVDPHGIPVPDTTASVVPDIVLLPLLAFDADGYRLGYGGGYFDRTLAGSRPRPLAIGVGFDLNAVVTTWPGPFDIALDLIATESGVKQPGAPLLAGTP
jgi:5-formyltetrahydrofolate cyclo-ligase